MNEIIQKLEANVTNGNENICEISEKMLNAIKELSKREYEEMQQLKERVNTLKDTQLKQLSIIQQRDEVIESLKTRIKTIKRLRKKQTQKKNKYKKLVTNRDNALKRKK